MSEVSQFSHEAVTVDNWQEGFLGKLSLATTVEAGTNRAMKAVIAHHLEQSYLAYRAIGRTVHEFSNDLDTVLVDTKIPSSLDSDDHTISLPGKRQPGFEESIGATLERYKFIEELPQSFDDVAYAIIVGGSMSYGPFFNVRSGKDNSDIDAIVVLSDDFLEGANPQSLINDKAINQKDKFHFLARAVDFREMYANGEADVISHRLRSADKQFNMSAHFFPRAVFDKTFGKGLESALEADENHTLVLRDYKPSPFERTACEFYGFGGDWFGLPVAREDKFADGSLAEIPAYVLLEGRYYPGLYQCLLLPTPLLVQGDSGKQADIARRFAATMEQRVLHERSFNQYASLSNANPRRMILPPGRYPSL